MLKIDKREVTKDNEKNLRTRKKNMNVNFGFIPNKSRVSSYIKDNKENEYRNNASTQKWDGNIEKKNLFNSGISGISGQSINTVIIKKNEKDNEVEKDNEDSNSGSIIDNDIDE